MLASLLVVATSGLAFSNVDAFPARVPEGPVLFVTQPDESTGKRREALVLLDPTGKSAPQRVLVTDENHRVEARVGREVLLVTVHRISWVVRLDMEKGEFRALLGGRRADLVSVDGSRAFIIEKIRDAALGYRLRPGEGGAAAIDDAPRPEARLFVVDDVASKEASARALPGEPFAAILHETKDRFFVVREAPLALVAIEKDGSGERVIAELQKDLVPTLMTAEVSPSGRYVAIGAADGGDFFDHRHLFVADAEKGGIVLEKRGIPVRVSMLSSQSPSLAMTWLDDETLRYSASVVSSSDRAREPDAVWVDVRVPKGEVLRSTPRGPVGLSHRKPLGDDVEPNTASDTGRRRDGLFEIEPGRLYFAGGSEPLIDTVDARGNSTWAEIVVSKDGRYAAFRGKDGVVIADGETKSTRIALPGWASGFEWR